MAELARMVSPLNGSATFRTASQAFSFGVMRLTCGPSRKRAYQLMSGTNGVGQGTLSSFNSEEPSCGGCSVPSCVDGVGGLLPACPLGCAAGLAAPCTGQGACGAAGCGVAATGVGDCGELCGCGESGSGAGVPGLCAALARVERLKAATTANIGERSACRWLRRNFAVLEQSVFSVFPEPFCTS